MLGLPYAMKYLGCGCSARVDANRVLTLTDTASAWTLTHICQLCISCRCYMHLCTHLPPDARKVLFGLCVRGG